MALVGDGPRRQELEALVAQQVLSDRVTFLGTRTDVPDILATADCYLQTSKEEGFGISVLEAMAGGLPVVSTRAGGLGPLVEGAGVLAEPGDWKTLAQGIRESCEDAKIRNERIKQGRARSREYDIQKTAKEYQRLYRPEV